MEVTGRCSCSGKTSLELFCSCVSPPAELRSTSCDVSGKGGLCWKNGHNKVVVVAAAAVTALTTNPLIKPLNSEANIAPLNNMKLVHSPLMDGLLHLVE